jgi:hypothetical protein
MGLGLGDPLVLADQASVPDHPLTMGVIVDVIGRISQHGDELSG